MGLLIHVDAYAGYRAYERPRRFELDGVEYRIYAWERAWRTPNTRSFLVRSGGKRYILCRDQRKDEWTVLSDFDGGELFQRPGVEVIAVGPSTIRAAEQQVAACERCRPADADWLFCSVLDEVSGRSGNTEYVMSEPAKCPNCRAEISEKTLVQLQGGIEVGSAV